MFEAIELWFARNGGIAVRQAKEVKIIHDQDEALFMKPKDFESHKPDVEVGRYKNNWIKLDSLK